jgi:hypothetical protein
MPDESNSPEKKLIIDEDWKSQVQAEKEAASTAKESIKSPEGEPSIGARGPLPPPDLTFLVSTLYLQGAMALGLLPNPVTKKADVRIDQAKHAIDLLTMLQQKTEGNRTPDESDDLEAALHELRLTFVGVNEQTAAQS